MSSNYQRWTAISPFLASVTLGLVTGPANAQVGTPTPAQAVEEGLRREEDRARLLQQQVQPKADVLQPAAPVSVSTVLPAETPCFAIQAVTFTGPDATRFSWLGDTAKPYIGQCAGVGGLRQIAAALDARLIDLGYVTSRVSLPQQNLKEGVVNFELHVGRVANVAMLTADKARSPDESWGAWHSAFPVSQGDILNVRDLEQGVEQMKRLPSQAVATEIEPGADFNTSNVKILRQAGTISERTRGGITLDNSGSRSLGTTQLSGYLSLDNPLGLNDILSVSVNSNAEHPGADHRSQSASLNYSVPWGYNTFTISKSNSRFAQIVQGTTVQFLSSGRSESAELRWHRTMLRTSATKVGAYVAVSTRRANSFLDDVELIVQRQRTTSLETGVTYKHLEGDATFDFSLGHRQGLAWQNAQDDLPTASTGGLTLRPNITTFSGMVSAPFKLAGRDVSYQTTIQAQTTPDTTLSVDQIAIGSRFTVRGFDGDSVLLAESGYFVRNEFSTPVKLVDGLNSIAFVGIDFGRVWGPSSALLIGTRLAGAAFGLRGQFKALQFDAAVGTPVYKPEGFRTRRWNPYLSVTYAF